MNELSPETIDRMARQLLGVSLEAADRQAVAELLASLEADMAAMNALDPSETEPVPVYKPK